MRFNGRIIDHYSREPIGGAMVQAYSPDTGLPYGSPIFSEGDGDWHIDVPDGSYILLMSYYGHETLQNTADQLGNGYTAGLPPGERILPGPGEMLPVVVTPQKKTMLIAVAIIGAAMVFRKQIQKVIGL